MTSGYLAIDWGTTNRRAYLLNAAGEILDMHQDDRGILTVEEAGFPAELAALRQRLGDLPAIAAGMIGSTRGWRDVPYVALPAGPADLAAGIVRIERERLAIVPGVSLDRDGRADVMRGEEVQALGAVAAGLAPPDALLCQPGTHNKWIRLAEGRIVDFATAMTGELFALLRDHSILAEMMPGRVIDGPAFREGVARAARGEALLSALFGVRASVVLGRHMRDEGAALASGLLIGADVAGHVASGDHVHVLADANLGSLYAAAILQCGGTPLPIDTQAAFVAGIHLVWRDYRD